MTLSQGNKLTERDFTLNKVSLIFEDAFFDISAYINFFVGSISPLNWKGIGFIIKFNRPN